MFGIVILATLVIASFAVYGNVINNDEKWWDAMREHMEDHWKEREELNVQGELDADWWDEIRDHMEDYMGEFGDEDWWDEMRNQMEDHWEELVDEDDHHSGSHDCH